MDKLAELLKTIGAPILATAIGGPVGTIASAAIGALADALGTAATPEAVASKLEASPIAETGPVVRAVEAEKGPEYLAELQARLADTQNARQQTLQLVESGSSMAWGAPAVSLFVLTGFIGLSFLAMKPDSAGVRPDVALYLLGAWQSLATAVVGYWIGSSAGSARNGDAMRALAQQATTPTTGQIVGKAVDAAAAKAASAVVTAATAKR